jgi:hypothetical protein
VRTCRRKENGCPEKTGEFQFKFQSNQAARNSFIKGQANNRTTRIKNEEFERTFDKIKNYVRYPAFILNVGFCNKTLVRNSVNRKLCSIYSDPKLKNGGIEINF